LMRRVWRGLRRWHQANPIGLAAAHARHHYDISTELYRLFLDDQRCNIPALIFETPSMKRSNRRSATS
jgi:cyclopropane fatty-acyl-phospholipid synthase-like methyltransferase